MATRTASAGEPSFNLGSPDWSKVLEGIKEAGKWLAVASPGDSQIEAVVASLVELATHPKWEVRRAIANVAGQHRDAAFETTLAKLRLDDNSQVGQAAEAANVRRRTWVDASAYGKQHEDHINSVLDGIEARFGTRGRSAVRRASEQIAETFARELYHEVIKRISPLATSAERLKKHLGAAAGREEVLEEVARLEGRIRDLRAVLDGMRAYTAQPKLLFTTESMMELVTEAAALVRDAHAVPSAPAIEVHGPELAPMVVSRQRVLQALTNLLHNAVEAYAGVENRNPITVTVASASGHVEVRVRDEGCGMSAEALADAKSLFVTSKPGGTGFGLPLVVKIIETEHEGHFRLESSPGKGTTACLVFPQQRRGQE